MTDLPSEESPSSTRASRPEYRLDADELRARGIDHALLASDADLIETVELLLGLGVRLAEMEGRDLTLLPGPRMTRPDAVPHPLVGVDYSDDFTRQLVLALGFHFGSDRLGMTPAELAALGFFSELRNVLPETEVLSIVRVVGTSMSAVARSVISALRLNYETPIIEETGSIVDVTRAYRTITEELLPPFLDALSTVARRHVARLAGEPALWEPDQTGTATHEQATIGFVDLVGFTEFTEQADAAQFVKTLRRFELQVNELIVGRGGVLVKLIGDEAMFATFEAATAVDIAKDLTELRVGPDGNGAVRVGIASGFVVTTGGDYYGTVVNTAARAVDLAKPGTAVATKATVEASGIVARPLGTHPLRGISETVELFELELS